MRKILLILSLLILILIFIPSVNANINMSTPYIEGNFIKSVYYINGTPSVNLWQSPYFVWGNYDYGNGIVKKSVCEYQNNNIFGCNLITGNYKFNMSYSDYYNYTNLSLTFYTGNIYIGNDTNTLMNVKKLNPEIRENILSNNFFDYIFIIFIIIITIYLFSFNRKDDDYDNR